MDIGFAFFSQFWCQDYAYEAASATIVHERQVLSLQRIMAITTPENQRPVHLLEKLGLHFERLVTLANNTQEFRLFATEV